MWHAHKIAFLAIGMQHYIYSQYTCNLTYARRHIAYQAMCRYNSTCIRNACNITYTAMCIEFHVCDNAHTIPSLPLYTCNITYFVCSITHVAMLIHHWCREYFNKQPLLCLTCKPAIDLVLSCVGKTVKVQSQGRKVPNCKDID